MGEDRTSSHPTIQPFSHPIIQSSRPPAERYLAVSRLIRPRPFPLDILVKTPAEVAQALNKGDFFLREIIVRGQTLYERPD